MTTSNKRNATKSALGYDYQFCYFLYLTIKYYVNGDTTITLKYEGNEDIDVYRNEILDELIQVKFHTSISASEGFGKDDGLFKVFKHFATNFHELEDVPTITYLVAIGESTTLSGPLSPFLEGNKTNEDLYKHLIKQNCFMEFKDYITSFCDKIQFKLISNETMSTIIDRLSILIQENNYLNSKLNTGTMLQFKNEYFISLIHRYAREHILSETSLNIFEMINSINEDISTEYTAIKLLDDTISLLNNENPSEMILALQNKLIVSCKSIKDLEIEYRLLKLKIINNDILDSLKRSIHDHSIIIYCKLLNEIPDSITNKQRSKIARNIANLFNKTRFTMTMDNELCKYYRKLKQTESEI